MSGSIKLPNVENTQVKYKYLKILGKIVLPSHSITAGACEETSHTHGSVSCQLQRLFFNNQKFKPKIKNHLHRSLKLKQNQLRFSQSVRHKGNDVTASVRWTTDSPSLPSCCRWPSASSSSSAAAPAASAASSAGTPSRCRRSPCTGARSGCWCLRRLR